jgi:hypothetical protein
MKARFDNSENPMRIPALSSTAIFSLLGATRCSVTHLSVREENRRAIVKPQPAEHIGIAPRKMSRTDKFIWLTAALICLLMAQANLIFGACAVTQTLLDQLSTNWLRNTHIAVDAMRAVASLLIATDVILTGWWLKRRISKYLGR